MRVIKLPHTRTIACPQAKSKGWQQHNSEKQNELEINCIFIFQGFALRVHLSQPKHFSRITSTLQQFQVSACVESSFLLRLCKRYYEETGSNFNSKSTEKSSFFISYKKGGNSFEHLTFIHVGELQNFYWCSETPSSRGKQVRPTPDPPESMMFPYKYICFRPSLFDFFYYFFFIPHTNLYYFYSENF